MIIHITFIVWIIDAEVYKIYVLTNNTQKYYLIKRSEQIPYLNNLDGENIILIYG